MDLKEAWAQWVVQAQDEELFHIDVMALLRHWQKTAREVIGFLIQLMQDGGGDHMGVSLSPLWRGGQ